MSHLPEVTTQAEFPWQRLHPLSPLLRGGIVLLVIVGIVFANFRDRLIAVVVGDQYIGESGPNEADLFNYLVEAELLIVGILLCIGVIVVIIGCAWVSWRFHTFRITQEAVEERSGVLFRQHRRAPIERIQSVNLQRPLIARLVGVTQVEVQTAGQDGKVTLSYLGFSAAKAVREEILLRVSQSGSGAHAARVGSAPRMSSSDQSVRPAASPVDALERRAAEIFDGDVSGESVANGLVVSVPVGRLLGSIALGWDLWAPLILVAASIFSAVVWDPFFLTLIIPAALMTVAFVFNSFNQGFRFTLSRSREGVRVGAGLTSTTTETIPFGRIHSLEAIQPLGWRWCGWWRVRITTAGNGLMSGGQNKLRNLVLPVGTLTEVEQVFATLLAGVSDTDGQRAALRAGLLGSGSTGGYTAAGKHSPWVLWLGARRAGIRVDQTGRLADATLRIRRGWCNRTFIVMPLVRAQSLQLNRPFIQRGLGLATVTAHTVLGPVQVYLRGLELGDARNLFDECVTTMIMVQRTDAHTHHTQQSVRAQRFDRTQRVTAVPVWVVDPPTFRNTPSELCDTASPHAATTEAEHQKAGEHADQ